MSDKNREARHSIRVKDETWRRLGKLQATLKAKREKQVTTDDVIREALDLLERETCDE